MKIRLETWLKKLEKKTVDNLADYLLSFYYVIARNRKYAFKHKNYVSYILGTIFLSDKK